LHLTAGDQIAEVDGEEAGVVEEDAASAIAARADLAYQD
jgi:hypothetical protein